VYTLLHSSVRLATGLAKLSVHVSRLSRAERFLQYIYEQMISLDIFSLTIIILLLLFLVSYAFAFVVGCLYIFILSLWCPVISLIQLLCQYISNKELNYIELKLLLLFWGEFI
jgi:hypothetical protein